MTSNNMWRRSLLAALCSAFVCVTQSGFAQGLPERFRGVWKNTAHQAGSCKQSDWNSDAHTDDHINVTPRQIDYHESACRYVSIQTTKPDHESSPARLTLSCAGEGEKWQSVQVWQIRSIGGIPMLITAITNRGRELISVYQQCVASEARTGPATVVAAITSLPLKPGYYVASDTPCGLASSGTLQLVRRNGINVARSICAFKKVEQMGPETYRVTEECKDLEQKAAETVINSYQIVNNGSFKSTSANGFVYNARHCEQSSLPAPWRNNDISNLIR